MSEAALSSSHTPRLIQEAMARRVRRAPRQGVGRGEGAGKRGNNYLAEAAPAAKAGAKPGNSNALRHGAYDAASRARRARVKRRVLHIHAVIARALMMAHSQNALCRKRNACQTAVPRPLSSSPCPASPACPFAICPRGRQRARPPPGGRPGKRLHRGKGGA
jgi:hypothetical protein